MLRRTSMRAAEWWNQKHFNAPAGGGPLGTKNNHRREGGVGISPMMNSEYFDAKPPKMAKRNEYKMWELEREANLECLREPYFVLVKEE
eukprot:TRINITY_DN18776_c0_g1_i1.p1 TRINITY_DN18776_c0_g1~~TRINITY_DN18776_c0_g1_i1.p1  ORF type:complete len:104 (+),score=24.62 TRINITY_DN18776_c0_g1_i1:48-314(+)